MVNNELKPEHGSSLSQASEDLSQLHGPKTEHAQSPDLQNAVTTETKVETPIQTGVSVDNQTAISQSSSADIAKEFQNISQPVENSQLDQLAIPSFHKILKEERTIEREPPRPSSERHHKKALTKSRNKKRQRFGKGDGTILDILITAVANALARLERAVKRPTTPQEVKRPPHVSKKPKRHSASTGFYAERDTVQEESNDVDDSASLDPSIPSDGGKTK